MCIAAAIAGSAVVGGVAASSAAKKQSKAANRAADLQQEQYGLTREDQQRQYEQTRADQMPFLEAGYGATNRLNQLLGITDKSFANFNAGAYLNANPDAKAWVASKSGQPGANAEQLAYEHFVADGARRTGNFFKNTLSPDYGKYARDFSMQDFQADPGYAFRVKEGLTALDRQAAARGGLISGGALKAAQRYGQDMGSQEYQNAFNRYQINRANQLNPLQAMAGQGQTSAGQLGNVGQSYASNLANAGQNYANQAGAAYGAAGQAQASGYMGMANAAAGGLGQYLNYQSNNSLINSLNRGQAPSGGGYGSYAAPSYGFGPNVRLGGG